MKGGSLIDRERYQDDEHMQFRHICPHGRGQDHAVGAAAVARLRAPQDCVDPQDTSKYILAARSPLEGGIFDPDGYYLSKQ